MGGILGAAGSTSNFLPQRLSGALYRQSLCTNWQRKNCKEPRCALTGQSARVNLELRDSKQYVVIIKYEIHIGIRN